MSYFQVIDGEIFTDERGSISCLNNFNLDGVKRFYLLHHPDVSVVRGWHGHKLEKKWFSCVKGAFTIGLVEIDDWEKPSLDLKPKILHVSDRKSQIICVPEGWASCIKAEIADSILLVLSGKRFEDAMAQPDSYRFAPDYWFPW